MPTPLWIALLALPQAPVADEDGAWPAEQAAFVQGYCFACHDAEKHRGRVDMESLRLDWEGDEPRETFERMVEMLASGEMPPEKAPRHPSEEERTAMVNWLRGQLEAHAVVGGTVLRRLNRVEYENTIRDLFGIDFELPASFPLDSTAQGFDTIGEALVISPPQLRQYLEVAAQVADELIQLQVPESLDRHFPGADFAGPLSGLLRDRQRLVNALDEVTWASKPEAFEAAFDGRYRLTVRAAAFGALPNRKSRLELRARDREAPPTDPVSACRLLASFELADETPRDYTVEADLRSGETLVLQFANSPLRKRDAFLVAPEAVQYMKREHRDFLDALIAVGYQPKQSDERNYERVVAAIGTSRGTPSSRQRGEFLHGLEQPGQARAFFLPVWRCVHEEGAGIDVFDLHVEGPIGPLQDLPRWLPERGGRDDRAYAEYVVRPLLRRALRRPVPDEELQRFVSLTLEHARQTGDLRHGLHFAIRVLLCSPDFLYRETREGPLDDHDLAARLSYFLWSTTPPDELLALANQGALSDPRRLESVVRRMIRDPRIRELGREFTGQWLWTRKIFGLMPDERLFPDWHQGMYAMLAEETERFFLAVLRENLDVENFIDSNFTFLNEPLAAIYGIPGVHGPDLRRVALDGTHHRGGVLGQAAVMMATANGVDTSPVIRGVWLLENIAGDGVGPPPDNVPALTPDSTGAVTIRERIAAHRADPMCARCHDRIDPMGFALEQFDAIGGWRDHYPRVVATDDGGSRVADGPAIDTSGVLPDGTRIEDLGDLRAYLLAHRHRFYRCLCEKLMVYATGRALNAADEGVVDDITQEAVMNGHGFADLVVAIVLSDAFRTK